MRRSNGSSQTAYSSPVRRTSVAARHWPRSRSPSNAANTVFVLPTSIASSIHCVRITEEDITGGDDPPLARDEIEQKSTAPVDPGEAATHRLIFQANGHWRGLLERACQPCAPYRLEAVATPGPVPAVQRVEIERRDVIDVEFARARLPQASRRIGPIDPRMVSNVDANPEHEPVERRAACRGLREEFQRPSLH